MIRDQGQPYIDLIRKYGGYDSPVRNRSSLYVQAMQKGLDTALAEDKAKQAEAALASISETELEDMTHQEREMMRFTEMLPSVPTDYDEEDEGVYEPPSEKPDLEDVLALMAPEEREMMAFAQ